MKMEKSTYDYLFGIIMDEKADITNKVVKDLLEGADAPDTKLKICQSAIIRLGNKDMSYKQIRDNVLLVCKVAKELSDEGDRITALKILDMLITSSTAMKCYSMIADEIVEIDKACVEKLLRSQFEVLKEKSTNPSRNTLISENKDGVQEREQFRSIAVEDFTKLALVWRDLVSISDAFPREVVEFSIPLAQDFWDYSEIGQFYEIIGDSIRALEFFRKSEPFIEEYFQAWVLVHNLWNMKNPDRDHSMEMMLKAIKMAVSSEHFTRLAEVAGNISGTLSDMELAIELYKKAQRVAVSYEELKSVQDSIAQMNKDIEFQSELDVHE